MPLECAARRRSRFSRKRATCLIAVYLVMVAHVVHWRLAGKTLAPLELNEVMYTLERGIVTAGFLFMLLTLAATAIFGRFFCSWGCHILAVQDLSAWLLSRVRIRPKPVRSRVLLLVPVAAMLYMFVWPQVAAALERRPIPVLHVRSDSDGWASFVTTDLWRNLPGPSVAVATIAVCGCFMAYVLGSRSFCTYGCPYGAVFALADRVAPGKIKSVRTDADCATCGLCTAACESHIRVHHELMIFGKVVSPACLKDLDCVAACPKGIVQYGWTKPGWFASWRQWGRFGVSYDFSVREDMVMALVFVTVLSAMRGVYELVPFFLALGIPSMGAYAAVLALRMWKRPNVRLNNFALKIGGAMTQHGKALAVLLVLGAAGVMHCGFIRWQEVRATRLFNELAERQAAGMLPLPIAQLDEAAGALETCARWGLVMPPRRELQLATVYCWAEDPARAEPHVRQWLRLNPTDHAWRIMLATMLAARGQYGPAHQELQHVISELGNSSSPECMRLLQVARQFEGEIREPHP